MGTTIGRAGCFVLAAALAAVGAARPAASAPPKEKGVGPVQGGSFPRRHEEYVALVAAGSDRALAEMVAAYRRRDVEPTERARIATLACDGFAGPQFTAALRAWREEADSVGDAWLWYRTLRREIGLEGGGGAVQAARDAGRPSVLRGAAIRALAAWADPAIPVLVTSLATGDLGKEPDRSVLLEALGDALASQAGRVGAPAVRQALQALVPFLRKEDALPRTRLALARAFARLLGAPRPSFDPAFYEALLDHLAATPNPEDDRYAPPRFFGLEASGDRIVYVVDESGSMDTPLTAREILDLRRSSVPKPAAKPPDPPDPMASIPWERIRTRHDAAVEFTKASIRSLPESASFAVVLFESGVRWLRGESTLVPATRANVEEAVRALGRRAPSGATNLHGGLRRAFDAVVSGRPLGPEAEASAAALARGPTTVFLLSDGHPCADDWGFWTTLAGTSPVASSRVPYSETESLVDDVERMNLLRACEIHAVGIGEFSEDLLDRLAHAGHGKVRRIGGAGSPHRPSGPGRAERVPGEGDPPAEEPPADAAACEADVEVLRGDAPVASKIAAARRLGRARWGPAVPELIGLLASASTASTQEAMRAAANEALAAVAGRSFGWAPSLAAHEREAIRRNWEWWWGLHRDALEKEAAERKSAGGAPPPGPK